MAIKRVLIVSVSELKDTCRELEELCEEQKEELENGDGGGGGGDFGGEGGDEDDSGMELDDTMSPEELALSTKALVPLGQLTQLLVLGAKSCNTVLPKVVEVRSQARWGDELGEVRAF
jgi:hypothetical protein